MKCWQQFEINELYVCIKFGGNKSRDFGFRTRKPSHKFGVKSGLSQNRLKHGKNILYGSMSSDTFHPNQPTFGHDEVHFFLLPFFFLTFVRSSSKSQNIEI